MADTRFAVRLDDLGRTVSRLQEVAVHLGQASGRLRGAGAAAAVGEADVQSGVEAFVAHWSQGVRDLQGTVEALHDALTTAHTAYGDTERALSAGLSPSLSGTAVPSTA